MVFILYRTELLCATEEQVLQHSLVTGNLIDPMNEKEVVHFDSFRNHNQKNVLVPSYNYTLFCRLYLCCKELEMPLSLVAEVTYPYECSLTLAVHLGTVLFRDNRLQHNIAKTQSYGNSWCELSLCKESENFEA